MTEQSNTLAHSVDISDNRRPADRRRRIVDLVTEQGSASVEMLAYALHQSRETIRRDLTLLDQQGFLKKFHGGARLPAPDRAGEGPISERMRQNTAAKRAIARQAATLFAKGESLFLDFGTTTLALAEQLADQSGLTIITNAESLAAPLARSGANRVFLLGGEYRPSGGATLGPSALAAVRGYSPTYAVLTIAGIDQQGLSDEDGEEAELARAMIAQASRLIVLFDHSKLGRRGLFPLCPLEKIDVAVTDRPLPETLAERIRRGGGRIVIASA